MRPSCLTPTTWDEDHRWRGRLRPLWRWRQWSSECVSERRAASHLLVPQNEGSLSHLFREVMNPYPTPFLSGPSEMLPE